MSNICSCAGQSSRRWYCTRYESCVRPLKKKPRPARVGSSRSACRSLMPSWTWMPPMIEAMVGVVGTLPVQHVVA